MNLARNLGVQFNGLSYPIVNIEEVYLSCFFVQYYSQSGRTIVSLLENFAKRKIFASILTQLKKRHLGIASGESRKKTSYPLELNIFFIFIR